MAAETLLALRNEKPVPIQFDFTLFHLAEPAGQDPSLAERQPYRGAVEFAYTTGAEDALDRAKTHGWTVVSMKEDWSAVFASA
jgi:hypothetical protein